MARWVHPSGLREGRFVAVSRPGRDSFVWRGVRRGRAGPRPEYSAPHPSKQSDLPCPDVHSRLRRDSDSVHTCARDLEIHSVSKLLETEFPEAVL